MTSIIFVLILTSLIIENSTVKRLNNESDGNKITNYSSYKNSVKINNKRFKEVVDYWKILLSNQNLTVILQTSLNKSFNNNDTKLKSNFKYSPYSKTYPVQINKKFKEIVDYWKIKNYEIFPFLSNKYLLSENLITLTELNALKFDCILKKAAIITSTKIVIIVLDCTKIPALDTYPVSAHNSLAKSSLKSLTIVNNI